MRTTRRNERRETKSTKIAGTEHQKSFANSITKGMLKIKILSYRSSKASILPTAQNYTCSTMEHGLQRLRVFVKVNESY